MKFVVDASVAVKWFVDETGSVEARALQGHDLLAPDLFFAEVANVLWGLRRRRLLTNEAYTVRIDALAAAPVAVTRTRDLIEMAAGLAVHMDHPVYDCIYVALAMHAGCQFVTADKKLHAAAAPLIGGDVIRIL